VSEGGNKEEKKKRGSKELREDIKYPGRGKEVGR